MNIKEIFKIKFDLPKDGFLEPIDLIDQKVGFSVYKERKIVGFKSLFRVYIENKELEDAKTLKSVTITVSYGKEYEGGIVISSSEFKIKKNWPVGLTSKDDFFYNVDENQFYDKKQAIDGIELLKKIDNWHTKTSKTIWGFTLRFKLILFHIIFASFFKFIFKIMGGALYLTSGLKANLFHDLKDLDRNIKSKGVGIPKTYPGDLIDIFGFKVEPWIAFLYSVFHLVFYFSFYSNNYRPLSLSTIFKNNFLTLMYVIISVGTAKILLPKILKPLQYLLLNLLKKIQSQYYKCLSAKIKIN